MTKQMSKIIIRYFSYSYIYIYYYYCLFIDLFVFICSIICFFKCSRISSSLGACDKAVPGRFPEVSL